MQRFAAHSPIRPKADLGLGGANGSSVRIADARKLGLGLLRDVALKAYAPDEAKPGIPHPPPQSRGQLQNPLEFRANRH